MANKTYPLVGPRYPVFIPCAPKNSKSRFLPWGRRPPQTLTLGSPYLRRREAAVRDSEQHEQPIDDQSYPRIWNLFPGQDN